MSTCLERAAPCYVLKQTVIGNGDKWIHLTQKAMNLLQRVYEEREAELGEQSDVPVKSFQTPADI